MLWRIEIKYKKGIFDAFSESVAKSIHDLGITSVSKVETIQIYNLEGQLASNDIEVICRNLFSDPDRKSVV